MVKRPKKRKRATESSTDRLWIAPRNKLKGSTDKGAWENHPGGAPDYNRLLEFADIAFGVKDPTSKKR